jgi:nitrogen fixation NifU-like protein
MNGFDDIYTDLIMEHSTNSFNKKELKEPTACMLGHNPNCGDEIELQVKIENGIITDASFSGHGCAISQSSTSIMIDTLRGKTVDEAKKIVEIFVKMIKREKITAKEKKLLGDSVAFENIANMPARVKCALLSWHTMEDILKK